MNNFFDTEDSRLNRQKAKLVGTGNDDDNIKKGMITINDWLVGWLQELHGWLVGCSD
jgi:hypothetical protein